MSTNWKHNNRSFPNIFSNFICIAFLLYLLRGYFSPNTDDVNVVVRNECNHTFVGFSDKVCLSDAEKLLHWIIEYISRVSCLSRACVFTVNFLKHIAGLGKGFLYLAFQRKVW